MFIVSFNKFQGHRFNPDSALWEYPCLSRHPVAQDGSQSLQESVQDREALGDKTFGRDRDGLFFSARDSQYQELFPTAAVPDTCNCGVRLVHNDVKLKALM